MVLSAYGVDLTPPKPIQYAMPKNVGDISSVLSAVNAGQNDANAANNLRYGQQLGVLTGGATGQAGSFASAKDILGTNYDSALGSLNNSLANNQTVFSNDQNRAIQDAVKAASTTQQSGISRGLGNTTIMNSMQDQVQRTKNDALANIAAQKAQADNAVYSNISSIYQNKGNAAAGLETQSGQSQMNNAGSIANAIGARNDVGPSIGDYAGLIEAAQAAKMQGPTTTRTTDPVAINSPLRTGGGSGGGGGGIAASQGNYSGGASGTGGYGGGSSGGGGGIVTNPGGQIAGLPSSGLGSFPGSGVASGFGSGSPSSLPPVPTFGGMGGGPIAAATTPAAPAGSGNEGDSSAGHWETGGPGIDGLTGQYSQFARYWVSNG